MHKKYVVVYQEQKTGRVGITFFKEDSEGEVTKRFYELCQKEVLPTMEFVILGITEIPKIKKKGN